MGPQHAYGLAARLEQVADNHLSLNQGTLYPALIRLEQKGWIKSTWQKTESNRDAKYYAITKPGERALGKQAERWRRLAGLVDKLLPRPSRSRLARGRRLHHRVPAGRAPCRAHRFDDRIEVRVTLDALRRWRRICPRGAPPRLTRWSLCESSRAEL